jgi:gliding motility-associated-like protein
MPLVVASATPTCYAEANGTASVVASAGTPAYTYLWSDGQTSATANQLMAGSYNVTVNDANNCTATATAMVAQPSSALTVIATPEAPSIMIGESITIALSNNYNDANAVYVTSPAYGLSCTDCAQLEAIPYQTTEYNVAVSDANGCKGSGKFTITVDQSIPVFIPNSFTPNGDGSNDTWGLYSAAVKQLNLSVFNRWGEKVFETDNMNYLWDGNYQGKPAAVGVYVYRGYVVYLNDKSRQVKGSVTLIR